MANRKLIVVGAVGGLLFVPLLVASLGLFDSTFPQISNAGSESIPDSEFASQFGENQGILRGVAFLWALTGIAFLGFVGAFYGGAPRQGERDWLATLALVAGALWAFTWVLAGLVMDGARSIDPLVGSASLAKTALTIARNLSFSHDLLLAAVFVGAASLATPASQGFPGLVKKTGVGAAVGLVLGSATLAIGQPFPVLPLGMMLFFAWVVATSVLLTRTNPET